MSLSPFTSNTDAPDYVLPLFHTRNDVSHSFDLFLPLKNSVFFKKIFSSYSWDEDFCSSEFLKNYFQNLII